MTLQLNDFCCPLCKGGLRDDQAAYYCAACEKRFPVVLGIPDFRVFPDPYIDYENNLAPAPPPG